MATEIERKFLVRGDSWREGASARWIRQGYLSISDRLSVRVRTLGDRAFLTVKGERQGMIRAEYEYEIPPADAHEMLDLFCARPLIEKTRYGLTHAGFEWVIDVFEGDNTGLVIAEVELTSPDQPLDLPPWIGDEVTHDPRYLNANLSRHPFAAWGSATNDGARQS
jgi:CYTH domain-containing protein